MKENNLLASVALFSELYNSNTYKSIPDIIAEFIKGACIYENKYSFSSAEMKSILKKVYGFDLPEAIIRTILNNKLKNIVSKQNNIYQIDPKIKQGLKKINDDYKAIHEIQKKVIDDLISYVQSNNAEMLTDGDKNNVVVNFGQFLMDNGYSAKYSNLISAFIILNENKDNFKDSLNNIREGIILYQGIKYTSDINELGKWNTDLTIYLGTEHLFNALGYNGILHAEIFQDFLSLVNEINISNKNGAFDDKRKINLKYFEETKTEIDIFFDTAELILKGQLPLDPTKLAMKEILNGSNSASDVRAKRIKFDMNLKQKGIYFDQSTYEVNRIQSYNVVDSNVIDNLKSISKDRKREFDEKLCNFYLQIFTKINTLRKGNNKLPFEKINYIYVSESSFAKYLGNNNIVKFADFDIPFIKDLDFITTTFWFKLKKGFSNKAALPSSFDVVTKAKLILSAHLSNSVSDNYNKLVNQVKEGKLSKEEALQRSYILREKPTTPEGITIETIDTTLSFLNDSQDMENYIREREGSDNLLKETTEKNIQLMKQLEDYKLNEENRKIAEKRQFYSEQQNSYTREKWKVFKNKNRQDCYYLILIVLLNFLLFSVALFLTLSSNVKVWLNEKKGVIQNLFILFYIIILVVELIGRSYLFNKDKIKNGWNWLTTINKKPIKTKMNQKFSDEYKKHFPFN